MRDILLDIIAQTGALVDTVKIDGDDQKTTIEAVSADNTLLITGSLRNPVPEFKGTFGITNLPFLKGILDFASYKADGASFSVKRAVHGGAETVEEFRFRDPSGSGTDFRTRSSGLAEVEIRSIPWDVSVVPNASKLSEFLTLTSLFTSVDKSFTAKTENGNLILVCGDETSSMHRANMIFESGIVGTLKGQAFWDIGLFTKVIGIAQKTKSFEIKLNRSVLGIFTETAHGSYTYYLRGSR